MTAIASCSRRAAGEVAATFTSRPRPTAPPARRSPVCPARSAPSASTSSCSRTSGCSASPTSASPRSSRASRRRARRLRTTPSRHSCRTWAWCACRENARSSWPTSPASSRAPTRARGSAPASCGTSSGRACSCTCSSDPGRRRRRDGSVAAARLRHDQPRARALRSRARQAPADRRAQQGLTYPREELAQAATAFARSEARSASRGTGHGGGTGEGVEGLVEERWGSVRARDGSRATARSRLSRGACGSCTTSPPVPSRFVQDVDAPARAQGRVKKRPLPSLATAREPQRTGLTKLPLLI